MVSGSPVRFGRPPILHEGYGGPHVAATDHSTAPPRNAGGRGRASKNGAALDTCWTHSPTGRAVGLRAGLVLPQRRHELRTPFKGVARLDRSVPGQASGLSLACLSSAGLERGPSTLSGRHLAHRGGFAIQAQSWGSFLLSPTHEAFADSSREPGPVA